MTNAYHEKDLFLDSTIPYSFRIYNNIKTGIDSIVAPHYHRFIELIYCEKGTLELSIDGIIHILSEGDFVMIPPMLTHSLHSLNTSTNQHIAILFEVDLLYSINYSVFEMQYILPFTSNLTESKFLFKYHEIQATPIIHLFQSIVEEEVKKAYGFELAIRTSINTIALWLLRYWNEQGLNLDLPTPLTHDTITRLNLVLDYVNQNYAQEISLEEMATLCNVSYSYFSRFFKKYVQKNFKEYVNSVRIKKAEDLLIRTSNSITDIGISVGFTTTSYFIQQFKLYKQLTPKKYRSLCHK